MQNLTDLQLIEQYKSTHDKKYVGELYKRYTGFVFSVSLKYLQDKELAKDAAMNIFEQLFSSLQTHSIQNFKPWLYMVTKNFCLQEIRKNKGFKQISFDTVNFHENSMENSEDVHLEEKFALEEKIELFTEQLQGLTEEQRICVELFYLKKLSYNQIIEQTGYSALQVKSFIQNGKRNLQIRLKNG